MRECRRAEVLEPVICVLISRNPRSHLQPSSAAAVRQQANFSVFQCDTETVRLILIDYGDVSHGANGETNEIEDGESGCGFTSADPYDPIPTFALAESPVGLPVAATS
jgi:hypothetical protein